jgi:hypothetical protein
LPCAIIPTVKCKQEERRIAVVVLVVVACGVQDSAEVGSLQIGEYPPLGLLVQMYSS